MTTPVPRYTLRQLPLPAKLVLSTFLITVGIGYFSAMVQLHFQHASKGQALPTPDDVVEKFSGLKRYDPTATPPVSKLQLILSGPGDGAFDKTNMAPAFFAKSGSSYERECNTRGKEVVDREREGERAALLAWINATPEARKKAYDNDTFQPPILGGKAPISEDFVDPESGSVQIRTLIEVRCLKCHGGDTKPDLDAYAKLEPLVTAPKLDLVDGQYVRSSRQLSVEGLTQSTHAHLLSFAILFTLTGMTFAFTSYPGFLRGTLGPLVLLAQVADIACWWLARLDGVGPTFALAIMGTGAVVGIGLLFQIILSLFNMYGLSGKLMLLLLFVVGIVGLNVLYSRVIEPTLSAEKAALATPPPETK